MMKVIPTFLFATLITGLFFISIPEIGNAGIAVIPGGPPCCEVRPGSATTCQGGLSGIELCDDSNVCDSIDCVFFDEAVCVQTDEFTGFCQSFEPTPPPTPANVPTLSGWGFISLAVVLGLIGLGAFLVRRKRASA